MADLYTLNAESFTGMDGYGPKKIANVLAGIADSRSEHYQVTLEGRIGARGLTLRAMDSMNNVSTTQVEAPAAR